VVTRDQYTGIAAVAVTALGLNQIPSVGSLGGPVALQQQLEAKNTELERLLRSELQSQSEAISASPVNPILRSIL
jgi:phage FluMu protein gp41